MRHTSLAKSSIHQWVRLTSSRFLRLRHEMMWVLIGQALAFIGSFANIKILTKIMGTAGYGQLGLGMTIAGILNLCVYAPFGNTVSRYYSVYRERRRLPDYFFVFRESHRYIALVIVAIGIGAMLVAFHLKASLWASIIFISCVFGIIAGWNTSFLSLQGAIRQRKIVALHQAADAWMRPLMAFLALHFLANTATCALCGYCIGTFIVTASQIFFTHQNQEFSGGWIESKEGNRSLRHSGYGELYRYAASFVAFAGFASITLYADRWIVQGFLGTQDVGIYVALYQIANAPLALMLGIITQFIVPIIYERAGAMVHKDQALRSGRLLSQTTIGTSVLLSMVVIATYFIGRPVAKLLTTAQFAQSAQILWILVLGLSFFQIAQLVATKGFYFNKPHIYFYPRLVYCVTFVAIAFAIVKRFGLEGMAWTTVLSAAVYLICVIQVTVKCKTPSVLNMTS